MFRSVACPVVLGVTEIDLGEDEDGSNRATGLRRKPLQISGAR
jgi:hypothetical protein